jgi:hypothetical protein
MNKKHKNFFLVPGKEKIKLSLCLAKHHATLSAPPEKRVPGTHWIEGWVGLVTTAKRKIPSACLV